MSASTPKKTGPWSEAEDRSILLQALYLGSTMIGMKHENIRVAGRTPRAVQERFTTLKKLAAKEFNNIKAGSASPMTSAPALPQFKLQNAAPRSDHRRSASIATISDNIFAYGNSSPANSSSDAMGEGFSKSSRLPVTPSRFPNDTRSSSSAYGTGQANRGKSFQAASTPIAPSKVTKKKNKSRTSKKKLKLDSFNVFSDESEEFSVYGETEDTDIGE